MSISTPLPGAVSRTGRAAAFVALSVALLLPTTWGNTSRAGGDPATGRQLAWWTGQGVGTLDDLARTLRDSGASVVRQLPLATSVVVDVPASWRAPAGVSSATDTALRVTGLEHDGAGRADRSSWAQAPGADSATAGEGVTVAVVDTGVADVPDLAGAVTHVNVSGAAAADGYGHGTFLAGIIAGSGASSQGRYTGVAPGAGILDVQVATADGSTSLLRVLAGLQAVADRARHDPSVRVVNLSLSADDPGAPGLDPLSRAVEALWNRGLVVVAAAGNTGPAAGTVTVPGTDPAVITVGALDTAETADRGDDTVPAFSSRGDGAAVKPDLVAPGVRVVGLRAPGSVIDRTYPQARIEDAYFRGSGTSMATAVAAASAAALLAQQPDLNPSTVKRAFTQSAYAVPGDRSATGAGALDLTAAAAAAHEITVAQQAWRGGPVAAAYQRFATSWRTGRAAAAQAAWLALPEALRADTAAAFATAVAADDRADADQARQAHDWAAGDLGPAWFSRAWVSRSWSSNDWASRSWSSRSWSSRSWSSRSWSVEDWASRSWSSRSWSAEDWASRSWSSRSWSAEDWASRSWSSRSWSADGWGEAIP